MADRITPGLLTIDERYNEPNLVGADGFMVAEIPETGMSPAWHAANKKGVHWGSDPRSHINRPLEEIDANARFLAAAWNCLVTAADTLNVDPLELAEALGEGRLGALLTVRGKPWESDSQFAEALERLVHLPKREAQTHG